MEDDYNYGIFFNHNSIYFMISFIFLIWKVDFVVKVLLVKTFGQELKGFICRNFSFLFFFKL